MSLPDQNFGFDPRGELTVIGREITLSFVIAGLQVADVDSAEWVLVDDSGDALITKTDVDGIALANISSGLQVTVSLEEEDTEELQADDYRHRLDYVRAGSGKRESLRGYGRLVAPI